MRFPNLTRVKNLPRVFLAYFSVVAIDEVVEDLELKFRPRDVVIEQRFQLPRKLGIHDREEKGQTEQFGQNIHLKENVISKLK